MFIHGVLSLNHARTWNTNIISFSRSPESRSDDAQNVPKVDANLGQCLHTHTRIFLLSHILGFRGKFHCWTPFYIIGSPAKLKFSVSNWKVWGNCSDVYGSVQCGTTFCFGFPWWCDSDKYKILEQKQLDRLWEVSKEASQYRKSRAKELSKETNRRRRLVHILSLHITAHLPTQPNPSYNLISSHNPVLT